MLTLAGIRQSSLFVNLLSLQSQSARATSNARPSNCGLSWFLVHNFRPTASRLFEARLLDVHDAATRSRPTTLAEAVEILVDAYDLSLTLGRPTGVAAWAERYACEFGRVGALGLAAAVSRTIALPRRPTMLTCPRLHAFLRGSMRKSRAARVEPGHADENPAAKTAEVLLAMLAARDVQAVAHARAVASWSRRLCAKIELSPRSHRVRISVRPVARHRHDLDAGSDSNRQGTLSGVETAIVRDHAAAGERILRGIPELERCADVVRSHHERFDGAGYPDGICTARTSRLKHALAVADAFHAMISERPYRHRSRRVRRYRSCKTDAERSGIRLSSTSCSACSRAACPWSCRHIPTFPPRSLSWRAEGNLLTGWWAGAS